MRESQNYRKLTKAANKKNKSEVEVYQDVSKCIDDIARDEEDKCLVIKSLIAYFEGKSSKSWFVSIMPISYALIIGATSMLPSLGMGRNDLLIIEGALLMAALLVVIVAINNLDFEKKVILCVLGNKLEEYTKMQDSQIKELIEANTLADMKEDESCKRVEVKEKAEVETE